MGRITEIIISKKGLIYPMRKLKDYSRSLLLVLLFQFFIILFFFFIIFFAIFYYVESSQIEKQNIRFLDRINRTIYNRLEEKKLFSRESLLSAEVEQMAADYDIILSVINARGEIVSDSRETYISPGPDSNMEEVTSALSGMQGTVVRKERLTREKYIYVATPIVKSGRLQMIIRSAVVYPITRYDILSLFFKTNRIAVIFIIIFLLLIIGQLKKITDPINNLSENFQKVARGELTMTLYPSQNEYHEIAELIKNYNSMMKELKNVNDDLKEQKLELKSILSSIQEGVVFINFQGNILGANENFCTFFCPASSAKDIRDNHYYQIIRDSELKKKINSVKENSITVKQMTEISYNQRYYICYIQLLKFKRNLILNFYDITDLRKLENMKSEFISNVSHELLTPLTAIQGFSETLIDDEVDEIKKRHLGIIYRHTQRMVNIVKDLLSLTKNELTGTAGLDLVSIDLANLIESVKILFTKKLEEKKLSLSLDISSALPVIEGDREKLEQLFINLIGNAVKYTDKGGVTVQMARAGRVIRIKIIDTGIGISEKDLPRIFGRFYVADKSRSKLSGGTGLGLSIVRQIINLHKGTINITSKINSGTEVTLELPVKL